RKWLALATSSPTSYLSSWNATSLEGLQNTTRASLVIGRGRRAAAQFEPILTLQRNRPAAGPRENRDGRFRWAGPLSFSLGGKSGSSFVVRDQEEFEALHEDDPDETDDSGSEDQEFAAVHYVRLYVNQLTDPSGMIINSISMKLVLITAGEFMMGERVGDHE